LIDKICLFLTNRIRKEMPDVDDERAEVINYGLQILIGEIPKIFVMLTVAWLLGVFKETLVVFLLLIPYRGASGGFHMHTHIGCIITTCCLYSGVALLSKYIVMQGIVKYLVVTCVWIFGVVMIKLYAPADTEDVPILETKVRRKKQIASYIWFSAELIAALIFTKPLIINLIVFGNLAQTLTITKFAYRLTKNKYGYEVYG
jgi:accessory gene regulator B